MAADRNFASFRDIVLNITKEETPNILTIARIAVIPLILLLMAIPSAFTAWSALILYTLACLTDWFDGYLARKWGTMSDIGKFLDPIADKLLVTALVLMLAVMGRLDGFWFIPAVVILSREIFISGLREFMGPKNIKVHVSKLAKWKTTAQMVSLGFLIMGEFSPPEIPSLWIGWLLLTLSAVLTAYTGWQYLQSALPSLTGDDDNDIIDANILDDDLDDEDE